jgi:hypothetical protein
MISIGAIFRWLLRMNHHQIPDLTVGLIIMLWLNYPRYFGKESKLYQEKLVD